MSEEKLTFDIEEIKKLLPHRYPFLLVDRVTECVPGKYAKGYKNLTYNENFFQGHFPNKAIMPGVLQIEAIAQLGAAALTTVKGFEAKFALFGGIDNARFKRMVCPGDRLDMEIEIVKLKSVAVKAHGKAFVDGQLTVEADMMFLLQ